MKFEKIGHTQAHTGGADISLLFSAGIVANRLGNFLFDVSYDASWAYP